MAERLLTGKELKHAAKAKIPVLYIECYINSQDTHMNYRGECVMESAKSGYYIGNSDINPEDFEDSQLVEGEFPEGSFKVCAVPGVKYNP